MIRKKIAIIFCTLIGVLILQGQSFAQGTTTFASGTAIIDMGSASPTVQNSLKPYGLVYGLLKNKHVPVSVVVNSTKVKDGIDFVYNGKSYSGGTFIISAEYITADVTAYLNSWATQGVLIDYANSDLTVNVTYKINFVPKWVLDKTNGVIAVGFFNAAGIPASAYSYKSVSQLGGCDDIFILPHADPTWNTHNNLYFWNKNNKGAIWAGCHAVSALEALSKDTTIGGTPTTIKMNFLSTNGLLNFSDHNVPNIPFTNQLPGDPVGQFYGKTDGAQQNGSETVYLPKIGSAWNTGSKIITYSPGQQDIPSLSPGLAVENIYGRGFDDATRGYVAYQAAHNIGGTTADQIAAQRIFFNFSFFALNDKVPPIISASLGGNASQLTSGTATSLSATVTGSGTGYTYQWSASVAGTFSNANAANTTFTPSSSITSLTTCIITCIVTESCGRVSFDSKKVNIIPPPASHTLTNVPITKAISDGCTVATIKFNVFDNNSDPDAGARTLLSVTGLGNGTVLTSTNGDVTFTSVANFKGSTTGSYIVTNGVSNSPSATIKITVGDSTKAPVMVTDAISALVDNVTVVNVLANDKNNDTAASGNLLYIRDIPQKPTKGYVYINSNGTLSYLSTKDQSSISGGDSFQYLACNTLGYCSVGTVNVTLVQDACPVNQYQTSTSGVKDSLVLQEPTKDSYLESGAGASSNFGNSTNLVLNGFANRSRRPIMTFNLSAIPTTATVNSATLSLTTSNAFTPVASAGNPDLNPFPASIYPVSPTNTWTEGTGGSNDVTYTNYTTASAWTTLGGDYSTSVSGTIPNTFTLSTTYPVGTVIASTDLSSVVQSWVSTPTNNNGLIVVTTTSYNTTLSLNFNSRDVATASLRPKLNVYYTYPSPCLNISTTSYKPIAYPDTSSTSSNTSKTIDVLANDANYYSNSNTPTISKQPLHGTASINGSNKLVYVPDGTFVGTDTLVYTITDAIKGTSNTAVVRITVTKVAPTIVRDDASTNSGNAVTINVGANDTDPQGSLTAPVITVNPKNGTAAVSGNNIVYTPLARFTGKDTLIYSRSGTAADACSSALSDTAIVIVTVNNQAPVATNDAISTFTCTPITIKIKNNDTDPENDALTVTIVTNPANGTLTANADGSYTYSPNTNFSGVDQFTYTVKDPGLLTSNVATATITVTAGANPNTAPSAVADSDNTLANQPVYTNVLANDSDPNNDPLSISITASGLKAPSNGTIQLMPNRLIKYTPNNNFTGTDTYEYQITDTHPSCAGSSSLTTKALVTIKVTAIPILAGGTIWNDVDYSGTETFTNIKTNTETGTNVNGSIYVYLTDSTNTILDYTPADDAGVYQLSNVPSNTPKLNLILSTQSLQVGGTLSAPSLPTGYTNTSPSARVFATGSTDITGYDFGIVATSVTGGTIALTPVSFCASGTPGSIASSVAATGFVSLIWQSSTTSGGSGFTDIAGATGATYTPASAITSTTWYRRKALGTGNAYAYSNAVMATVNPLPVVTVSPTSIVIAAGASTTLSASGAATYSWTPATNLSATTGASVVATTAAAGSIIYTVTGTSINGCTSTASTTVTASSLPIASAITGPCAVIKDSTRTFTVSAINATRYVWTLPSGWVGSSTTNSISVKVNNTGGTITATPFNGNIQGNTVSYTANVIDYAKSLP